MARPALPLYRLSCCWRLLGSCAHRLAVRLRCCWPQLEVVVEVVVVAIRCVVGLVGRRVVGILLLLRHARLVELVLPRLEVVAALLVALEEANPPCGSYRPQSEILSRLCTLCIRL